MNLVSALEEYQLDRRKVYRPRGLEPIRTKARGLNRHTVFSKVRIYPIWFLVCQRKKLVVMSYWGVGSGAGVVKSEFLIANRHSPAVDYQLNKRRGIVGGKSGGGTPGSIPNPAVKATSVDGSAGATLCESRPSPTIPLLFFFCQNFLFVFRSFVVY